MKAKTQVVVGNTNASSSDVYKKMIKKQGIRVSYAYPFRCNCTPFDSLISNMYAYYIATPFLQSLFIGFDAQIMRDMPFYAFFFGTYELNCYLFRTYVPSMPEELNYFLR